VAAQNHIIARLCLRVMYNTLDSILFLVKAVRVLDVGPVGEDHVHSGADVLQSTEKQMLKDAHLRSGESGRVWADGGAQPADAAQSAERKPLLESRLKGRDGVERDRVHDSGGGASASDAEQIPKSKLAEGGLEGPDGVEGARVTDGVQPSLNAGQSLKSLSDQGRNKTPDGVKEVRMHGGDSVPSSAAEQSLKSTPAEGGLKGPDGVEGARVHDRVQALSDAGQFLKSKPGEGEAMGPDGVGVHGGDSAPSSESEHSLKHKPAGGARMRSGEVEAIRELDGAAFATDAEIKRKTEDGGHKVPGAKMGGGVHDLKEEHPECGTLKAGGMGGNGANGGSLPPYLPQARGGGGKEGPGARAANMPIESQEKDPPSAIEGEIAANSKPTARSKEGWAFDEWSGRGESLLAELGLSEVEPRSSGNGGQKVLEGTPTKVPPPEIRPERWLVKSPRAQPPMEHRVEGSPTQKPPPETRPEKWQDESPRAKPPMEHRVEGWSEAWVGSQSVGLSVRSPAKSWQSSQRQNVPGSPTEGWNTHTPPHYQHGKEGGFRFARRVDAEGGRDAVRAAGREYSGVSRGGGGWGESREAGRDFMAGRRARESNHSLEMDDHNLSGPNQHNSNHVRELGRPSFGRSHNPYPLAAERTDDWGNPTSHLPVSMNAHCCGPDATTRESWRGSSDDTQRRNYDLMVARLAKGEAPWNMPSLYAAVDRAEAGRYRAVSTVYGRWLASMNGAGGTLCSADGGGSFVWEVAGSMLGAAGKMAVKHGFGGRGRRGWGVGAIS
jgi:hypothetical protein